jgi:predicted Zn-dependent peptidase
MKDNPTVTVMVMVEAGARYETRETNGLSHFLEHMCFKGTQKRNSKQIIYELESMGAITNAFTGYDYTGYYAKGRKELFPKLLDIVSDVYLNSTFPEAEIEKERGVICGEIDMSEDMPQMKVAYLGIESVYGDQPAGFTITGPKENILNFTRKDFTNYHKKHYVAEKTILVVAGGVESRDVESLAQKAFQGILNTKRVNKKKISSNQGMRVLLSDKKTDQTHLFFGMKGISLNHKDYLAFELMISVLGRGMSSRLFMRLREEMGAGYYVSADVSGADDGSLFEMSTGTSPARVTEVITAILEEVKKLKQEKVRVEELSKTKEYIIGVSSLARESSHRVAERVALRAIFHQPLKTYREIEKELRQITPDDILRVAKRYLDINKMHLAIIGPHKDTKSIEQVFEA